MNKPQKEKNDMKYTICMDPYNLGEWFRCRQTWFDKDKAIGVAEQLASDSCDISYCVIDETGKVVWEKST